MTHMRSSCARLLHVLAWAWWLLGVCVSIQWFYWAVMQTGALVGLNDAPAVSPVWLALASWGAFFFSVAMLVAKDDA